MLHDFKSEDTQATCYNQHELFQVSQGLPMTQSTDFEGFAPQMSTSFAGFHEDDIAKSYLRFSEASARLEDPFIEVITQLALLSTASLDSMFHPIFFWL